VVFVDAATNPGATVANTGNEAANLSQVSAKQKTPATGTVTNDPGQELINHALTSISHILDMTPTTTLNYLVNTTDQIITASAQQTLSCHPHPDRPETELNHTEHQDHEGMVGTDDEPGAHDMTEESPAKPSTSV
jgi:hypothetical protein